MTFKEWFDELLHDTNNYTPEILAEKEVAAMLAWNAALNEAKSIIENMDGCSDVQWCRRDGLRQIEELR